MSGKKIENIVLLCYNNYYKNQNNTVRDKRFPLEEGREKSYFVRVRVGGGKYLTLFYFFP